MTKNQNVSTIQRITWLLCLSMLLCGMTTETSLPSHDPTEPPAALIPAKGNEVNYRSLNLTATFIGSDKRWAIINGQTYHEGEAIGEYIITNIMIDAVELVDSGNNKEILRLVAPIKKALPTKEE